MTGQRPAGVLLDYGGVLDDRRPGRVRDGFGSFPLHPDAVTAVGALAAMGLVLVVASGTRPGQDRRAALRPVTHLLRAVVQTSDPGVGVGKGDRCFWRIGAIMAGAGDLTYVGDGYADVLAALAAGVDRAVLITGQAPAGLPSRIQVAASISAVPPLLQHVAAGLGGRQDVDQAGPAGPAGPVGPVGEVG